MQARQGSLEIVDSAQRRLPNRVNRRDRWNAIVCLFGGKKKILLKIARGEEMHDKEER